MSNIEKANNDYCKDTMKLKTSIEVSFLELGKRLRVIRDERKFEPEWEAFDDYLMEMRITKGTASKLINIYERFVLEYKIPVPRLAAVGWSPLSEILPVVRTKKDAEHWIHVASENPLRELRDEIREKKTGVEQSKCEHKGGWITIRICKVCKLKEVTDGK